MPLFKKLLLIIHHIKKQRGKKSYDGKYYKTLARESKKQLTCYRKMPPADRDTFNSLILICMTSISFSCLIDPATTSSTVLTRSGESGYLCLL